MLIAIRQLNSAIKTLNSLSVKMKTEKNSNIEGDYKKTENYQNIKNAYLKILSSTHELIHLRYREIPEIKNLYSARSFTKRMFNMISDEKNAADFVEYLRSTLETLKDCSEEDDDHWAHDFDYEWRDQILNPSLFPADAEIISKIIKVEDDRKIKVFDTNCGSGENLCNLDASLNDNHIDTETFAICYGQYLTYGKGLIDRTIFQGEKKFSVSKNVFDIVLTTPQILLDDDDAFKRANRYDFFNRAISYLRPEGILIIGIPFYRMTDNFALQILKNLESVQWIPASRDLIFIVGKKRISKLNNRDVEIEKLDELKNIVQDFEEVSDSDEQKNYLPLTLPKGSLEVEKFRGGAITDYEITQAYQTTQSMEDFLKDQEVDLNDEQKQRPLLPFTLGQIGLILTSGFLDGVIDEGNGHKHVVKGRVRKFTENDIDVEHVKGKMNIDEVTGNRVEINLFLPDGTFKALA